MGTKVIINPKTGMAETVSDWDTRVTPEQVAETRRKLRDMLSGNTQFHKDEWDQHENKNEKVLDKDEQTDDTGDFYGGFFP